MFYVERGINVNCGVSHGQFTALSEIIAQVERTSGERGLEHIYHDVLQVLDYLLTKNLDVNAINPSTNKPFIVDPRLNPVIREKLLQTRRVNPSLLADIPAHSHLGSVFQALHTRAEFAPVSASATVPKSAGYALGPASACAAPGVSSSSPAMGSVSVSSSSSSASSAVAPSSASRAPAPMAWAWSQSCSAPSTSAASSLALPADKKPMFSIEEDEEVENYIAHLKRLDSPDSRSKVEELEGFRDPVTACLFSDAVYLLADNGIYERQTLLDILAKAQKNKEDAITPETRVKFTRKDISEQIPRMILASAARCKQDAKRWKQAQDAAQKDQDASSQKICQL